MPLRSRLIPKYSERYHKCKRDNKMILYADNNDKDKIWVRRRTSQIHLASMSIYVPLFWGLFLILPWWPALDWYIISMSVIFQMKTLSLPKRSTKRYNFSQRRCCFIVLTRKMYIEWTFFYPFLHITDNEYHSACLWEPRAIHPSPKVIRHYSEVFF